MTADQNTAAPPPSKLNTSIFQKPLNILTWILAWDVMFLWKNTDVSVLKKLIFTNLIVFALVFLAISMHIENESPISLSDNHLGGAILHQNIFPAASKVSFSMINLTILTSGFLASVSLPMLIIPIIVRLTSSKTKFNYTSLNYSVLNRFKQNPRKQFWLNLCFSIFLILLIPNVKFYIAGAIPHYFEWDQNEWFKWIQIYLVTRFFALMSAVFLFVFLLLSRRTSK